MFMIKPYASTESPWSQEQWDQAVALIRKNTTSQGTIVSPVSLVQRHLLISYELGLAMVTEMQGVGLVSAPIDGGTVRQVLD
jgi:hypothetical protein